MSYTTKDAYFDYSQQSHDGHENYRVGFDDGENNRPKRKNWGQDYNDGYSEGLQCRQTG